MAGRFSLAARALAATACVSLMVTPAAAHGGWGGHRHHDDDGISAGDVFAGLLIIGGIAAIASAASKSKKDDSREAEDGYRYDPPQQEDSWRSEPSWQQDNSSSSGTDYSRPSRALDAAVDACTAAAEKAGQVDEIYGVQRDAAGYKVSGKLRSGREFTCATGADGAVDSMTVDGRELAGI